MQPVGGDIRINVRVGSDGGKNKYEYQTQRQRSEADQQEESKVLAHEFAHHRNIPRSRDSGDSKQSLPKSIQLYVVEFVMPGSPSAMPLTMFDLGSLRAYD